ncbi:MAG: hypothetical protein ACI8ZM_003808 [Crocinitomix sp.]|jgi:hypothetical protein
MDISNRITENLALYSTKLSLINGKINDQMELPRNQRNHWYLSFLYKEREVYEFATDEMEKIQKT